MRIGRLWTVSVLGTVLLGAAETVAQEQPSATDEVLEARIWLDRGVDPVLRRGDWARVYYRASRDAYVSVFHIDTNGFARLLHPGSPFDDHYALGERDYRVLFPKSRYWHVDEDEGKGYLFIVASPVPLDFSGFPYARYAGGWDISAVAQAGYRDPFLMMDDIVESLIPQSWAAEYALDFVAYDIDRPHDYPRFLCYDCHGFIPMFDWNPYDHWCTDFRVVIHDDPYYYPVYRYRGDRVVYTRPVARLGPMFEFKERARDEPATPLIRTRQGREPWAQARGMGEGVTPRAVPEAGRPPAARVPRLREPFRPPTGERSEASAPPRGAAPPGRAEQPVRSVRPGVRVPASPVEPPAGVGGRAPVEGADAVVRPESAGGRVEGAPTAGQPGADALAPVKPGADALRPVTPGAGPPSRDVPARVAGDRSGVAVPAGARSAEGREERPVLRRRGEPPGAGSTRTPTARPRTPPDRRPPPPGARPPSAGGSPPPAGRPPSSAGRPPSRPSESPAAAARGRSPPATRPPPAVRSGPPPRSSGSPPAARRGSRPPGRPPVPRP